VTNNDRPWLKSYDAWVEPDIDLPEVSCTDLVDEIFERYPDRAALHFLGTSIDFKRFKDLSLRFTDYLVQNGCQPGDVVAINLPNIPQYLIAQAGCLLAGVAATGLSPLLTPKEMAYQINDSGAKALVTLDAIFEKRLLKIKDKLPKLDLVVATGVLDFAPPIKRFLGNLLKKVPRGKVCPIEGKSVITFNRVLKECLPQKPELQVGPDDTALIQYTGGTTGVPKGAVLTHRGLIANMFQATQWVQMKEGSEVYCSAFPFFHLAGLAFGLSGLGKGSTQILIPNPRDTRHICKEMARYRPSVLCNVPSLYQMLLNEPLFAGLDFTSLKMCISGAAPFPTDTLKALDKTVGAGKVVEVYGMTETSPLITMNPYKGRKKIGSIGLPIQNTYVKLADLQAGTTEVAPGEPGELIVRGPQVMKEYFNRPEETAKTIKEFGGVTWLFTGDVAVMDEDGFFTLVDRAKDMLIVSGYKVFSKEVEETLQQHPHVEICAIVGVPDPKKPGNDKVKAVIQLAAEKSGQNSPQGEQEIMEYCRENMAPYKVPKIIEFMEELPLTAVGKVDKKLLR
jgi:long-chain acyl-CoA synthetase